MNNGLEKFINDNRGEFDSEEMRINWEKIKSGMENKNPVIRKMKHYWWAVAASLLILVSGAIYFNAGDKAVIVAEQIPALDLPPEEITNQVDPAYTTQMDQFAILIAHKQKELNLNQKTQPELYKQFLKDNNRLDSSYNYLKSQLAANPNKEILLDAMIENLELKLEILTRQLKIIKQSKHKKTNNESKTI
ncbi:MAG TPA: hypothetical protein VMY77_05915 [Chitinophagaceae bacterium]|nr:hypothetical protein [Chitinophagaceae bacterium]